MRKYPFFCICALILAACKTAPPPPAPPPPEPEEMPFSALAFDRIEGSGIHQVVLYYHLETENPRSTSMVFELQNWKVKINGHEPEPQAAVLKRDGAVFSHTKWKVAPGETQQMEFELHLDLNELAASVKESGAGGYLRANDKTFITELILEPSYRYGTAAPLMDSLTALAEFPRIQEPVFSIITIAIMQAELINTRFAVTLKIDNPNPFPVTLSSFKYELYGHDMFWADGSERNVFTIPAMNSSEKKLFLVMNFIDMKRDLLDEIIAMELVNYRFAGAAVVSTNISWLPQFSMKFDRSGFSEVFE